MSGCTELFFCFKQKAAYDMRISDCSSDVYSSDLSSSTISPSALRRRSPDTRSAVMASPKSQPRTACSAIWIGASQAARSASVTLSASCEAQWKVSRMSAIVGFSRAFAETLEQDRQQNERQQGGGDEAADHDDGEGALDLRSRAGREQQRQKAEGRDAGGHQDGKQAQYGAEATRLGHDPPP